MSNSNPFTRSDTMVGICQSIADDFGFNPLYLRVLFAFGLFVSLKWSVLVYLGLGVVVLASRLLFRGPRTATSSLATDTPTPDSEDDQLPLAA
ncbi:PspC domain-containing protein [Sphingomonas aerophila]|jgi:phage shock protein C|uniref:Phage shock protein PspC (Stress-responsive transcriptional regulator) n=1 Tax=Sphingomonas aerophila TaxID=1344948 RepID=A0A7W9BGA2_9SPHN|nr:PspC domain-containing protein [Sphingomonas aerophila]MBB5716384.1 phage shock protein PspC (stress-responsive transcriptional regulator) [Sphingomonas aerophila]